MEENQEQSTAKSDWLSPLQLVTNLAVVAGILVLIYELNQTRDLAQVQTFDSAYVAAMSRNLALLGETPHESIARAIFKPGDVTPGDVVVMTQYYNAVVVSWRRLKDKRAIGYFGGGWEAVVSEEAFNFNTQFGRKWWDAYRQFGDPEIIAVVDAVLERSSVAESLKFYESLLPESAGSDPN